MACAVGWVESFVLQPLHAMQVHASPFACLHHGGAHQLPATWQHTLHGRLTLPHHGWYPTAGHHQRGSADRRAPGAGGRRLEGAALVVQHMHDCGMLIAAVLPCCWLQQLLTTLLC